MARNSGKTALVLGAGVAGAAVAQRLGRAGMQVHLVEREPRIGGHAREVGCKATDVCLRCNACVADDFFRSIPGEPRVRLHLSTELADLRPGTNGARFVAALAPRGAAAAKRAAGRLPVDVVVLATGFEPFNPAENSAYRHGGIPNVLTGDEAERGLAQQQRIVRASDGAVPKRIAFIQCVGSRTEEIDRRPEDSDYCSAVCCAYALRMARQLKHQSAESDITVFYMDIQNFGKGFDEFYRECRNGMRFVRSRPYALRAGPGGSVIVTYAPESAQPRDGRGVCEESFDLVVLAVGIRPRPDGRALADALGVPLDPHGFFGIKGGGPLPDLQRAGFYVAGACESPKDIAGCLAQAEAVSASILADCGLGASAAEPATGLMQKPVARLLAGGARASRRPVCPDAVVVGGGIAGMQAALSLARLGHPVTLLHASDGLGGEAGAAPELYGHVGEDPGEAAGAVAARVADLAARIRAEPGVRLCPGASLRSIGGELGDFTVEVAGPDGVSARRAGAVVLAPGRPGRPAIEAAGLASGAGVVDLAGLLDRVRGNRAPRSVAILLDVTSEQGRDATARALSAAERLARRGGTRVKLFCRHVRVGAAGIESLYRRARAAGLVVVKGDAAPAIARLDDGTVRIEAADPVAGGTVAEVFDLAVIADAAVAGAAGDGAARAAGVRAGPGGAMQADNVWLLPTLTNRPGILVAGGARGNSEYRDAMTDGMAAADRVHRWLGGGELRVAADAAEVDADQCVLCLTCLRICPHGAIRIDGEKKAASVSAVACQRCGICAAECPARAIALPAFADERLAGELGAAPAVTVFACENSAVPAAQSAGAAAPGVTLVRVPCAGKVDPKLVLAALEKGAQRVLVLGCHPQSCRYLDGSSRAERRVRRLGAMLEKAGFDRRRVQFHGIASVEAKRFAEVVGGI